MPSPSFFENLLRTIPFPFKDPRWLPKIAIGSGIALGMFIIPIVPVLLIAGYCKRIMERIIVEKGEPYLPEWDNWEKLLSDGLKLWGAGMIYGLPILLLVMLAMIPMGIMFFSPLLFVREGNESSLPLIVMFLSMAVFFVFFFLAILLGMAASLLRTPAIGHLVAKNSFSAAFHFRDWWPILKKGIGAFLVSYLMIMLLTMGFTFVMQFFALSIVLIFAYPLLLFPYSFLLSVYQYTFEALAYREGAGTLIP